MLTTTTDSFRVGRNGVQQWKQPYDITHLNASNIDSEVRTWTKKKMSSSTSNINSQLTKQLWIYSLNISRITPSRPHRVQLKKFSVESDRWQIISGTTLSDS